jgi:hypothetical protein
MRFTFTRKKAIALGVGFCGLFLVLFLSRMTGPSSALPPSQCLSRPYEVLAEYGHYQVIQEKQESYGHHHPEILVSVVDGICSRLNVELDGMDYPFARYIDEKAAIALNVQIFKKRIEDEGGVQAFEKGFANFVAEPGMQVGRNDNPRSPQLIYMPYDKYEALKVLGVKIPNNVKPANEPN